MVIGNNIFKLGTKIWDSIVQRKFPLTGSERWPIAQDENGTGGKYYVDVDGIASYIGSASSYAALIPITLTSTGTQTYVGTGNPTQTSYSTIKLYVVPINFTNTSAAATLNIDGLGAKSIFKLVSGVKTALVAGDLTSTQTYVFYYDGTDFIIFNGKINTFYDNNGNLMIIGLSNDLYFPVGFDAQSTTDNSQIFIRDGVTRKLVGYSADLSTSYVDKARGIAGNSRKRNPIAPYNSITDANANTSFDTYSLIVVNNGDYSSGESGEIYKDGVNYFINNGAIIERSFVTASASNVLIDVRGFGENRVPIGYTNSTVYFNLPYIKNNGESTIINTTGCVLKINAYEISAFANPANVSTNVVVRLTNTAFNITSSIIRKIGVSGVGTGGQPVININGGSGYINCNEIVCSNSDNTYYAVSISGACGNIYLKAKLIAAYSDDFVTPVFTHPQILTVTNSSGTVYIDVDTIYGGVVLAPTSTGRVVLRVGNKIIANLSNGDTLTMGANCFFTGIAKNEATTGNATALKLTASNACVKDVALQGGHDSARGNSAVDLIVAGTLSTEVAKNANVTIIGGTYTQNSNFSNL